MRCGMLMGLFLHGVTHRVLYSVEGGALPNVIHNKVVLNLMGVGSLVLGVVVTIVVSTFLLAASPPTAAATTIILSCRSVSPALLPLSYSALAPSLRHSLSPTTKLLSLTECRQLMQGPFSLCTCKTPPTSILHTSPHWSFSQARHCSLRECTAHCPP